MNLWLPSLILGCFLTLHPLAAVEENLTLILDMENREALPIHFRSVTDALHFSAENSNTNTEGLNQLKMSGSGQFSKKSLNTILKRLDTPQAFVVIDLRQESHGFLDGAAISWFAPRNWGNKGLNLIEITRKEASLLQGLHDSKEVTLYKIRTKDQNGVIATSDPLIMTVQNTDTEQKITTEQQADYFRLPVLDHFMPSDEIVDNFILFVNDLPSNTWIHLHCDAGEGRTTTFMILYDMLRNAKKVSLEEIITRQWLLGGVNIKVLPELSAWNFDFALERLLFLKQFYNYCKTNSDQYKTSWSSYKEKQR